MDRPRCSVITATRDLKAKTMARCIQSIGRQTIPVQHVIVTEGHRHVDLDWTQHWNDWPDRVLVGVGWLNNDPQLPDSPGATAYEIGVRCADGEYIAFCGDDDELLPDHCERAIRRIEAEEADFCWVEVDFRVDGQTQEFVGTVSDPLNKLDTIGIVAKGECFLSQNWAQTGQCSDHELVQSWLDQGLKMCRQERPTAIHHDGWLKLAREKRGIK
jgi:Glycosyl transferase family 2